MVDLAILGAGAWGTALAIQAVRAGTGAVTLWTRDPAQAAIMQATGQNAKRLPGMTLPKALSMTASLEAAVAKAQLLVLAVPTQQLTTLLGSLPRPLPPLLVASKGVEQHGYRLPLEVIAGLAPGIQAGILSGPNFAHEIAQGLPAAAVIASDDAALREAAMLALGTPAFRLYANTDTIGVQVGGAAKNVIAIAAGIVIGARLGENARAALITRGLAEIGRLATALGGRPETVSGLSGLGDLLLTATSPASRNTSLGIALGRGETLAGILAKREAVTEGVTTTPALLARAAALGIDLPISAAVAAVLNGSLQVAQAMEALLARPIGLE